MILPRIHRIRQEGEMTAIDEREPVSARVKVDGQHRILLPRLIRDTAGVDAGDELIAIVDFRGRIVLASRQNVAAELRASYAAGKSVAEPPEDSSAWLRRTRDDEALAEDERRQRQATPPPSDPHR